MIINKNVEQLTNVNSQQLRVTHKDLIKFGVDTSNNLSDAKSKDQYIRKVESIVYSFSLPEVAYALYSDETIQIIRKRRLKKYRIEVDRKTGLIINPMKSFADVYKFDEETFPEDESVSITKVGYWNTNNEYIYDQ